MTDAIPTTTPEVRLEAGAYEVIRQRLTKQAESLRTALDALNADRRGIFGATEINLAATARLTTDNNCTPRDMAAIGPRRFVFGYNVTMGLKSSTSVADVFAVYDHEPSDHSFHPNKSGLLDDKAFNEDFEYLFRYYKNASFLKFHRSGPHLFMVMRVGRELTEIKAFKWLVDEDLGSLSYLGSRFDHEVRPPPSHEFEWVRARRDAFRLGTHSHVSIEDRLFVETVGGDLTIKVEDNTATGAGIYSEPVANADQTLDDAEFHYAIIGNLILLKVLPYQEKEWRYFAFHERTREVHRIDSLAQSCVLLPEGHGILYPGGLVLQTGGVKRFELGVPPMLFERRLNSANGEDTLFTFHDLESGSYLLLAYNLVEQSVATPIVCHGFSHFPTGELVVFTSDPEPRRHHVVQVWQTPFVKEHQATKERADSLLGKIGNADIVRCMAECRGVLTLLTKDDSYGGIYVDLVRDAGDVADTYFWLDRPEAHGIKSVLSEIKGTAEAALAEFEKVRRMRKEAEDRVAEARRAVETALKKASQTAADDVLSFVSLLAELRVQRGKVISLRDVRYADLAELERLDKAVAEGSTKLGELCTAFLLKPEALVPYQKRINEQVAQVEKVAKVAEAEALNAEFQKISGELELLIEVVGSLKIQDATETTRIIENISALYAKLNQARSLLQNRRRELGRAEGAAEFQAQLSLLQQAVSNHLEGCDGPEKCDEALTKVMALLEELEGRFSEFDEFIEQLHRKREEVSAAFDARRQSLVEARNRRAQSLAQSADRILASVRNRLAGFTQSEEVHAFLAADLMVAKARDIMEQLRALGDSVRADDLGTRLKSLRERAVEQIRDKSELFAEGGDLIQLGNHRFTVNRQALELTLLPREGELFFHLTGTQFFQKATHPDLDALRGVWDQGVVSENAQVYRGEYLAWRFVQTNPASATLEEVRAFMSERYQEGYTRGVHDHDASLIASAWLEIRHSLGALRFSPTERALALLFWKSWSGDEKEIISATLLAQGSAQSYFGTHAVPSASIVARLESELRRFWTDHSLGEVFPDRPGFIASAVEYLIHELSATKPHAGRSIPSACTAEARRMADHFRKLITTRLAQSDYEASLSPVEDRPATAYRIILSWLRACPVDGAALAGCFEEAAALLLLGGNVIQHAVPQEVIVSREIAGLTGSHSRLESGKYVLDYHEFNARLRPYQATEVVSFEALQALKQKLAGARRAELRLEEFKAEVITSFVRNRLIDRVYLPMIGTNLAKQLGAAGADARTDRMGMLLLISPPGYGKTTLMEYVANRLGITLVKINGPAIGHRVTSLDPAEAPNASARREVEKLNLALEMGDNLMIYLDDIQHCNPEFLQKFIPLCDAQRRIEGVFEGKGCTYDLRGRKVAVVMAGNPYTEVGGKFQVPDMLANRADTYNLGDILGGHEGDFKDSYIENSMRSNKALARIAARSYNDALSILKIASSGSREGVDFESSTSGDEVEEALAVMRHLLRVRETIWRVNQEYIRSAAMEDAYRVEPSFKLQGSYRNMNKIAERIQPMMTELEVRAVIDDHYRGESQTLSQAAEANLLKFREIEGLQTVAEKSRWDEIKRTFGRNLLLGGNAENDPVSRIGGHMATFTAGLGKIEDVLRANTQPATIADITVEKLREIISALRAVPVNVEIKVQPVEPSSQRVEELPVEVKSTVTQAD